MPLRTSEVPRFSLPQDVLVAADTLSLETISSESSSCSDLEKRLSSDFEWLKIRNNLLPGKYHLQDYLRKCLREKGFWVTRSSQIPAELKIELCRYFSGAKATDEPLPDFLNSLYNVFSGNIRRQCKPHHFLLLIYFVGTTVDEVFSRCQTALAIEQGPWPCLNPTSTCTGNLTIQRFKCSRHHQRAAIRAKCAIAGGAGLC